MRKLEEGGITKEEYDDLIQLDADHSQMKQVYKRCTHCQPLIDYLNRKDVREAMHFPINSDDWINCRRDVTRAYTRDAIGTQYIWEELKGLYKMIMVSGDADLVVSTWGSYRWM